MAQRKYSRQREAILQFLKGRTDHPTADVIFAALREEYPNISLGTVYRNLALLTDLGTILTLSAGDGKEHYDWDTSAHSHFVCRACGSVTDIRTACPEELLEQASFESGGTVHSAQVFFYGICGKCAGR